MVVYGIIIYQISVWLTFLMIIDSTEKSVAGDRSCFHLHVMCKHLGSTIKLHEHLEVFQQYKLE